MDILIIGNGGREHTIAWKISKSNKANNIYVAPGNAGTDLMPNVTNVNINPDNIFALRDFAIANNIALTIVGPEAPLIAGITDEFEKNNLKCFGPTKAASLLEGSKAFAKNFFQTFKIPTAKYGVFVDYDAAIKYLKTQSIPIVIKADGLAAGKGVVIADSFNDAVLAIEDVLLNNKFSNNTVIIEEFLTGTELSYTVLTDGNNILPLASSQDHKRRDNHDTGPNTGGMGAFSPSPWCNQNIEQEILNTIIKPTVAGMNSINTPFKGVLYAGLMLTEHGPKILEYNCRFGDPETQVILPRLDSDLVDVILACIDNNLNSIKPKWSDNTAINIVIAANGYPNKYSTNHDISHIKEITDNALIFHSGTKLDNNKIITTGGRILSVTAMAPNIKQAKSIAYNAVNKIIWDGAFCRLDIGSKARDCHKFCVNSHN